MSKVENNNYNWFNSQNHLNSNIFTHIKDINTNNVLNYWNNQIENRELLAIKEFHKREYRNYIKTLTNDVVRIEFTQIAFQYPKHDNIANLSIFDNIEFLEEIKTIYDIEEPEINNSDLVNRLNYNSQYLFDVINTYDNIVSNHVDKREILIEVYNNTHKSRLSTDKMNNWIDNFPNMIDNKINALKNKLKNKNKDKSRSRKAKLRYKTSELRFKNIIRKLNSLGYYGFDITQIRSNMITLEDDEIITDMMNEFSEVNQDHDTLEIIGDHEKRIYDEQLAKYKHYNGDE